MANTWWVRPNTVSNGDGTSYATAWSGWGNIVWASVLAGDTIKMCGTHAYSASVVTTKNGSAGAPITLDGSYAADPGTLAFTGNYMLAPSHSYWTFTDFRVIPGTSSCVYLQNVISNVTMRMLKMIDGGVQGIYFGIGGGFKYTDILIDQCEFAGDFRSGSNPSGAVYWRVYGGGLISNLTRVTVSKCNFHDIDTGRSVILFLNQPGSDASTNMSDITIADNSFARCNGVQIEVNDNVSSFGHSSGLQILRNAAQSGNLATVSGGIGGFIFANGFGSSSALGIPLIERNTCSNMTGNVGAIDLLYGSYIIRFNKGDTLYADTIDGNGVLFDIGCNNCIAYGNEFSNLYGASSGVNKDYSGFGFILLASTNCSAWNNIVRNARGALHVGGAGAGQSGSFYANTFLDMSVRGVQMLSTANPAGVTFKNNALRAASGSVNSVENAAAAWTGEDYNAWQGFAAASGHSLGAHDLSIADLMVTPDGRPLAGSPLIRAGVHLGYGRDFDGRQRWNPPTIGAFEAIQTRGALTQLRTPRT